MNQHDFIRRSRLPVDAETAYAWHAREGALERLLPPWEDVHVVSRTGGLTEGSCVVLRMRLGPIPITWVAEHRDCIPPRQFRDAQIRGPFARWEHLHAFEPETPTTCFLEDRIDYALPAGPLGDGLDAVWIRDRLRRMFDYRHATTIADLSAHGRFADRPPWTIAVSGASGLIGAALVPFLTAAGHRVRRIVRSNPDEAAGDLFFSAETDRVVPAAFEGLDAVVHLAGDNIASGRWTPERKQRIRTSRIDATRALCAMLARLANPPRVLVCASAVGFYGDRPGEMLDENAPPGQGFLAEVCREWEMATEPARQSGIRVVSARFGMVLSPRGGALASMLTPFRLGFGGRIGNGRQHWSWISIDDAVGAIHHAVMTETLEGPLNATSPEAVENRKFAATRSSVLRRPALATLPAAAVRLALGEMATEVLLADVRAAPRRLEEAGYSFRHRSLETALRHVLGRNPVSPATG